MLDSFISGYLIKHYDNLLTQSKSKYVPEIWKELTFEEHIKTILLLVS